ncbi:MAG: uroporphyrinogen-III synthase [Nitrosomonadales bacterium]|nr:uroporphyrinogen-III synthase [Nitrosomonadales bacterium]
MASAALSHKHVVITRPLGQAGKLKALIEAQGGEAVLFPLIAITPLDDYSVFDEILGTLERYDWIIFISSNAVQNGMPRLLKVFNELPKNLQFAAIGPVTAAELREFGVPHILIPEGRFDSESLLALPQMQNVGGKRCMIVRGVGGRDVLAETLTSRGAAVKFAECYQRVNPQTNAGLLHTLWQNKQLDALVVTSSEAMRHLLDLANDKTQVVHWLSDTAICVNHARIAEEVGNRQLNIHIAEAPGDEAMLQCLIRTLTPPT